MDSTTALLGIALIILASVYGGGFIGWSRGRKSGWHTGFNNGAERAYYHGYREGWNASEEAAGARRPVPLPGRPNAYRAVHSIDRTQLLPAVTSTGEGN